VKKNLNLKTKDVIELDISKKQYRTRWVPIRTLSLIPMTVKITIEQIMPLYKKLAPKIRELKTLGMTNSKNS